MGSLILAASRERAPEQAAKGMTLAHTEYAGRYVTLGLVEQKMYGLRNIWWLVEGTKGREGGPSWSRGRERQNPGVGREGKP